MPHTNHSPKLISTVGLLLLSWCLCQKKCEPKNKGGKTGDQPSGNTSGAEKNLSENSGSRTGLDEATLKLAKESVGDDLRKLLEAIENGYDAEIRKGINKKDDDGNAPLHAVVKSDSAYKKEILRCLLKNGADAKLQNKDRNTALNLLLQKKEAPDQNLLEVLLSKKDSLNVANNDGMTPLMTAVKNRHSKAVEALLKQKVALQSTDKQKNNVLHYTLIEWHEIFFRGILNYADWDVLATRNKKGNLAVHIAAGNERGPTSDEAKVHTLKSIIEKMVEEVPAGTSKGDLENLLKDQDGKNPVEIFKAKAAPGGKYSNQEKDIEDALKTLTNKGK